MERQDLATKMRQSMIGLSLASNMIDWVGLRPDVTTQLCQQVFAGEEPEVIPERDVAHQSVLLDAYCRIQPDLGRQLAEYIL